MSKTDLMLFCKKCNKTMFFEYLPSQKHIGKPYKCPGCGSRK